MGCNKWLGPPKQTSPHTTSRCKERDRLFIKQILGSLGFLDFGFFGDMLSNLRYKPKLGAFDTGFLGIRGFFQINPLIFNSVWIFYVCWIFGFFQRNAHLTGEVKVFFPFNEVNIILFLCLLDFWVFQWSTHTIFSVCWIFGFLGFSMKYT